MRVAHLGDVVAAARVLRAVPADQRAGLMEQLLREAREAFAHGRAFGCNHPCWGDGSLMAAALSYPMVPDPGLADPDFRRCLGMVLSALTDPGDDAHPDAQDMHRTAVGSGARRAAAMASPQSSQ